MENRYRIALDGVPLDSLSPAIWVEDVLEAAPETVITTHDLAAGHGTVFTGQRRRALTVQCRFAVRETDIARRQAVLDRVAGWAAGERVLTLSTRPGRRLRVRATLLPTALSALKWTETLNLVLTAYAVPFWEDEIPARLTLNGTDAADTLCVGGTAPAAVEAALTVTGQEPLTFLTLTVGETQVSLSGFSLAAGTEMRIGRSVNGLMTLTADGQSLLDRVDAASDDRLCARPGANAVRLNASTGVQAALQARGCWL